MYRRHNLKRPGTGRKQVALLPMFLTYTSAPGVLLALGAQG